MQARLVNRSRERFIWRTSVAISIVLVQAEHRRLLALVERCADAR
jgi:hypothetical protein